MQAFFADPHGDGRLEPLSGATSGWNSDHIRGPAIAGALVRAAESVPRQPGARLARVSFEFFRPSRMRPSTTEAVCVRQGRRLALIDAILIQDGAPTARAHLLYAATSDEASGALWANDDALQAPAAEIPADSENRLYRSGAEPWTSDPGRLRNNSRKQVWQRAHRIVADEEPSSDQLVAAASDLTNIVVHLGSRGIEHINADLTLALSRPPTTPGIGIAATHRLTDTGISIGSAVLFDAHGTFGLTSVVALSNVDNAVAL